MDLTKQIALGWFLVVSATWNDNHRRPTILLVHDNDDAPIYFLLFAFQRKPGGTYPMALPWISSVLSVRLVGTQRNRPMLSNGPHGRRTALVSWIN